MAQTESSQKLFTVVLVLSVEDGRVAASRTVQVKASSLVIAEKRALKRNPGAIGIKRRS
jgi:hypothetical protein